MKTRHMAHWSTNLAIASWGLSIIQISLQVPPVTAKSLWSSTPATYGNDSSDTYILKTGYLVGNGKLGAIPYGPPGAEKFVLNLDSLWSGGPFELGDKYTGGNPAEPVYESLPGIRDWIFQNGTGNVSALLHNITGFGHYQTLGNLSITVASIADTPYIHYNRSLDLTTGVHTTSWQTAAITNNYNNSNDNVTNGSLASSFQSTLFCSYPAQSCIYALHSNTSLPGPVTVSLENQFLNRSLVDITCNSSAGYTRLSGITQADIGLPFAAIARVLQPLDSGRNAPTLARTRCPGGGDDGARPGDLVVDPAPGQTALAIIWSAESQYDQTKGRAQDDYSFRSDEDPRHAVERKTAAVVGGSHSYESLLQDHVADYSSLMGQFSLDLPDTAHSAGLETSALVARYTNESSDPFLEALMFDYGRHLLVSSSREGALPPNLQGVWTESFWPAWDGSYVLDINVQMAYWGAEQTGLGALSRPLFDFMANTWAPRGAETARLLYNGTGWVTHSAMNTFGYTGMEEVAMWTNYPAMAAWIMQHVFDHYDYSRNATWLAERGYPMLQAIASFWLSQLQEDLFFHDGSLVVNPCNSPEHGPTTFGCAHFGQVIHQVFEAVLSTAAVVGDPDTAFRDSVASALARLDTGVHIDDSEESSSSQPGVLKEWKVPDAYLYNVYPVHRHISHLVGWFPGYSIASFLGGGNGGGGGGGYANGTIQAAVRASLVARGDGTALDGDGGDYGWPKVWRGACWARLNDSARAYQGLQLSMAHNTAANLLSMYGGSGPPFQIDMNLGWAGNVLSMLVVDLPSPAAHGNATRTVVLGPALPPAWGRGRVAGLRVRGGAVVGFEWDRYGVVTRKEVVVAGGEGEGAAPPVRFVNVHGDEV